MTDHAIQAAEIIKQQVKGFRPKLAVILGSGLGGLADDIEHPVAISYDTLPGFHKPKVEGHVGQFVLGKLAGEDVMCMQGRAHMYEGISGSVVQTMVRTCHLLGCTSIMITCASGSLHESIQPGSLVAISDHINLQFKNSLLGPNDERFGPRFIGMEDAYDPALRDQLQRVAKSLDIPLKEGVYICVLGPSFETPAEIRAFRMLGADLVGMSLVPEVIVARHCGMKVLGISVATNLAAGLHQGVLSHNDTMHGAKLATTNMVRLVKHYIKSLTVPANS